MRIHRMGEGADYTGLKPVGKIELPIAAADKSLQSGKLQDVAQLIATRNWRKVCTGITKR